MSDPVDHPPHYNGHPSGVECIDVAEHMNFCRGNALKYLWRAGLKGDELEDLRKARWYLDREIRRLERESGAPADQPKAPSATREEAIAAFEARWKIVADNQV